MKDSDYIYSFQYDSTLTHDAVSTAFTHCHLSSESVSQKPHGGVLGS